MRLHRTGPDIHWILDKVPLFPGIQNMSQDDHMLVNLNPEYAWTPVCLDWVF